MRFHVLLNSPFKVLFNFPSRYLSAIGLVQVFSLRWSLPPIFGLHSQTTRLRGSSKTRTTGAPHGPDTLSGQGHDQEDLDARRRANRLPIHHISRRPRAGRFGAGLFPLHSPLLGESLLVSFPPLTDMLKFSGYSRLIRGRISSVLVELAAAEERGRVIRATSPPSQLATSDRSSRGERVRLRHQPPRRETTVGGRRRSRSATLYGGRASSDVLSKVARATQRAAAELTR